MVREENLDNLVGQYFSRGREFCEVGSADEYRAIISLDESQARRIVAGQSAKLRLRAMSGETFDGTITSTPVSSLAKLTVGGSANITGGDVPTTVGRDGTLEPSVSYYEAEMIVRDPQGGTPARRADGDGAHPDRAHDHGPGARELGARPDQSGDQVVRLVRSRQLSAYPNIYPFRL